METKNHNSKLRASIAIRNFNIIYSLHYEQMIKIEENFADTNNNAFSIIQVNSSSEMLEQWKCILNEVNICISGINQLLRSAHEKIESRFKFDSNELWKNFKGYIIKLKEECKNLETFGFEILPGNEHKHWQKDICNLEDVILPLIISHAEACKFELEMMEKYSPRELDTITQSMLKYIPVEFTYEEADKYEKEYVNAVNILKKENNRKKNLWDRFLDILAGGTHQTPSEYVMMQRWVEGEKHDL